MGQTLYHTALLAPSLQGADPWSIASAIGITVMDLGSVVRSLEALRGKKTTSRRPTDPWSI